MGKDQEFMIVTTSLCWSTAAVAHNIYRMHINIYTAQVRSFAKNVIRTEMVVQAFPQLC